MRRFSKDLLKKITPLFLSVSFLSPPIIKAKSRFYVASQYQVGKMIMQKYNDLKRTIEGASFSLGWEINPTNYWFYSRYYFFMDYGNVMLNKRTGAQANMFTYGLGGDLIVEYNKNPMYVFSLFYGMQIAENTWTISKHSANFIIDDWRSIQGFSLKTSNFRMLGLVGFKFQTVLFNHDASIEVGVKWPFAFEYNSPFVRMFAIFISHTFYL
ncbi:outer membrane protein [Helicobacter acinonychis]|uniref:OMP1332 n=1 Tax=Helicobacter acinonychis TaxID=212 RepID=A0A1M4NFL7_HELAC|nr:outer membrane protein [Helicobacter acinonychis]SFZ70540.1 OMP979 [Helicobacter acinonychis]SFZ70654.1 OMP1332 [Helicobacter acinonychis]STP05005.1 outer membrane protein [Helicobacter acinonychis]